MLGVETLKYLLSFYYGEFDGGWRFDQSIAEMNEADAVKQAAVFAEQLGWLVNRDGTKVAQDQSPHLLRSWRNGKLMWKVAFDYVAILGYELNHYHSPTLGYIWVDDATGAFLHQGIRERCHQNADEGVLTEREAVEFARRAAAAEGWQWHEPAIGQIHRGIWTIRTDVLFADAWIYLEFNEKFGKVLRKSCLPRAEKGALLRREDILEIARKEFAVRELWLPEPVSVKFEQNVWTLHLPPLMDYSASIKIADVSGEVLEVYSWSGLGGMHYDWRKES